MKTIGEIVAENVRQKREARGLTQPELAKLSGVSIQTIFRLENGKTHPQAKNLKAIASALGVDQTALLGGKPAAPRDLLMQILPLLPSASEGDLETILSVLQKGQASKGKSKREV